MHIGYSNVRHTPKAQSSELKYPFIKATISFSKHVHLNSFQAFCYSSINHMNVVEELDVQPSHQDLMLAGNVPANQ